LNEEFRSMDNALAVEKGKLDQLAVVGSPAMENSPASRPLDGFDSLIREADARSEPVGVAVAGGDDLTVLEALRTALDRGWVRPILVGPEGRTRALAEEKGIALDGFRVVPAEGDDVARTAVDLVRSGEARALMKGQIATPALMGPVLDPSAGLRTGRVICQVVLMEIPRDGRRFLLADTGISVRPDLRRRIDILRLSVEVAHALGVERPRVALMAATETVKLDMPETVEADELSRRNREGELADCLIEGPLSFDLAYAVEAGARKRIEGSVVGAADVMIFPNLLAANLTVKAIMYTADCRFGGVLRGTSAPVVFMSRADSPAARLHSLALTLRIIDRGDGAS
jgi:phosphate butyryltransferase